VPGSIELHLLYHVTLLYCQVDPDPKPKAKSKAKKSLLPLPILPLMWQLLAHLNQCYSSNSLPFLPCDKDISVEMFKVSHTCHALSNDLVAKALEWEPPESSWEVKFTFSSVCVQKKDFGEALQGLQI
jgi:hypothetical protein